MADKRVVVITGGASGIGRSLALLCAKQGDAVAILDCDTNAAEDAAALAVERGASPAIAVTCDVSVESSVEAAFNQVEKELGIATAIFANAGTERSAAFHEMPSQLWRLVLETNLTGVFYTCRRAIGTLMRNRVAGSIVCTSSPAASVAFAAGGAAAYASSKGGISSLVRCLAVEYARHGIRVNALVPGSTETHLMWASVAPDRIPEARRQIASEIPIGRLADPDEPARAALWLLSDNASYVTGSELVCDGGTLAKASVSF